MTQLASVLGNALLDHKWLSTVVLVGLGLMGFMHFSVWWFRHFVNWTHQMRRQWRRFKTT